MDKITFFTLFFFFLFGCLQIGGQTKVEEKNICFFGKIDDGFNAIARGIPNATIKWFDPDLFSPPEMEKCKIIVVKDDEKGRYADRLLRQKIRNAVWGGSTLLVYKEAATLVRNDSSVLGWNLIIGEVIPCEIAPTAERKTFGERIVNGTLIITERDAATEGITSMAANEWAITEVSVKEGKQLAIIREGKLPSSPAVVAILKANYGFGQTYYFAYNPLLTPGIVANIFFSVYAQ